MSRAQGDSVIGLELSEIDHRQLEPLIGLLAELLMEERMRELENMEIEDGQ